MRKLQSLLWIAASALATAPGCEDDSVVGSTQQLRTGQDRRGSTLVGFDVLVTDGTDSAIDCRDGELTATVEVSWNGGAWEPLSDDTITISCAGGESPRVAMVLDNSGSLASDLDQLKAAARVVADAVVENNGAASLVRVSTDAKVWSPVSADRDAIDSAISDLYVARGWTALYDGIRMGNETLGGDAIADARLPQDGVAAFCGVERRVAVLAFTDGGENNSSHQRLMNADYPGDGLNTTLDDLYKLSVGGISTPIYTVGLGDKVDVAALSDLAEHTGGRYLPASSADDLPEVFAKVSDYLGSTHQVCTKVGLGRCGPAQVRVAYSWSDGTRTVTGTTEQTLEIPCGKKPVGKVVNVLLTLSNPFMADGVRTTLARNILEYTQPNAAPKVLVVLDDNHHGEFANDAELVVGDLSAHGYSVTYLPEPPDGISPDHVAGFDVVWFSNPGYPMDDRRSFETLVEFSAGGGGVILQGDDMAASWGQSFDLEPLSGLRFVDNGTSYCDVAIDNNSGGAYTVAINDGSPLAAGVEGASFRYGDDIDTSVANDRVEVVAWAGIAGRENCPLKPAIVAYTPDVQLQNNE